MTVRTLVFVALAVSTAAHGQGSKDERGADAVDQLKRAYLACDRAASGARLDTASVMHCSIVYEELKRRAFSGDFGRLLAWSRAQPSATATADAR